MTYIITLHEIEWDTKQDGMVTPQEQLGLPSASRPIEVEADSLDEAVEMAVDTYSDEMAWRISDFRLYVGAVDVKK